MTVNNDIVKALGKVEIVNLAERKVTCMTSRNFRVAASFPPSAAMLQVPSVGDVWSIELSLGTWSLVSRVDDNNRLFWAYKAVATANKDEDVFGDTIISADNLLRAYDKYGPLFDEDKPWLIHPSRLSEETFAGAFYIADATVVSVSSLGVEISWVKDGKILTGRGPGEQGLYQVGSLVKATVSQSGQVMWVSLPLEYIEDADKIPYGPIGGMIVGWSGDLVEYGELLEQHKNLLATHGEKMLAHEGVMEQLHEDLEEKDRALEQLQLDLAEAQEAVDSVQEKILDIDAEIVINGGKTTVSIYEPTNADGLNKQVGAIWYYYDEDYKNILAYYTWDGTKWAITMSQIEGVAGLSEKLQEAEDNLAAEKLRVTEALQKANKAKDDAEQAAEDAATAVQDVLANREAMLVGQTTWFAYSSSRTEAPETDWSMTPPVFPAGPYLWKREDVRHGDGSLVEGEPYLVTGGSGAKGEDAAQVKIESSRGVTFKNNSISTDLNVTIFYGGLTITDIAGLWDAFGTGAYLEWQWRREDDEEFGLVSSADDRLSRSGFTLTVSPDDVDEQTTFRVTLNT